MVQGAFATLSFVAMKLALAFVSAIAAVLAAPLVSALPAGYVWVAVPCSAKQ